MLFIDIEVIDYEIGKIKPTWWKEILDIFLKENESFSISCWKDEEYLIEKALTYGAYSENNDFGNNLIKIDGIVTKDMIRGINENHTPIAVDGIYLFCEFHSLLVGAKYNSAHYGGQVYLTNLSEEEEKQVDRILSDCDEYLKVDKILDR